jgi:hypothetical protein
MYRTLILTLMMALVALVEPMFATGLHESAGLVHMPTWLQALGLAVVGVTVLSTTNLTLVERAKRLDPNGQPAKIAELLSQTNEMLDDMPFKEGNLTTGEITTVRTALPTVYWRLLNQGVLPSKSRAVQITEQTGMLEAYSQVDKALADLGGNPGALRLSEARAFFEAMNQEMQSTVIYGTASAPEEFIGLAVRYSDTTAGNGDNIIKAGGTGSTDNTSAWLIAWDEETVTGIYPKGSQAGLVHEDLGIETVENAGGVTGALMRAYRDHWVWHAGIAVKDYRYVVRIANIDVSNLAVTSDAADLLTLMGDAEERLPNSLGRRVWYMNRTLRRYLRRQERSAVAGGGGLTYQNVAGKPTMFFGDTPIKRCDAILSTEDVIT